MSATVVILLMGVATFVPRLLGLALAGRTLPPFWVRFLQFVPISVFAALIVPSLAGAGGLPLRLASAALAGLVLWKRRSMALGIAVGMAAFLLGRALLQ